MKVLHLATGRKYDVWAMCNDDETCQILGTLSSVGGEHPDLVEAISALLFEEVPNQGPPLHDSFRAKKLYKDILFELKATKVIERAPVGLRIAFFFDEEYIGGSVVICTNAFFKSGTSTPEESLTLALMERARYFSEKNQMEMLWL